MTKKLWVALCLTFLLGIFSLSIGQTRAEGLVIDQENSTGSPGYLTINNHVGIAQSFTPSVGTIDKVDVYLKDMVKGEWMGIEILDSNQTSLISFGHRMSGGTAWESFSLNPLGVTAGQTYFIRLSTTTAGVQWAYNDGAYAGGSGWYGSGFHEDVDFWFKTYYTSSSAFDDGSSTGTQTNSTSSTGTAMSATTSAAIGKPSNLTAKFVDNANQRGVNLEWKKSSTDDIYGYLIFRSEKSASGYAKIGEITKESLSFLDKNVSASKTYYYQVRAYKGTEQSASSNTATITTSADIGPAIPANLRITQVGNDFIGVIWDKNTEANLAGYTITIFNGDDQIATAELAKDAFNYKFSGLTPSTSYKIKLVAKDTSGKYSLDAWTFGATLTPLNTSYTFNIWSGLLALIDVALLILLIVMMAKRHKTTKK